MDSNLACHFPPAAPVPPSPPPLPPFSPYDRPCRCAGTPWPCYDSSSDTCSGGWLDVDSLTREEMIQRCGRNAPCFRTAILPPAPPAIPPLAPAAPPTPPAPPPAPHAPGYSAGCSNTQQHICTCARVRWTVREACICGEPARYGHNGCCNVGCGECGEGELQLDCGDRPPLPPATPLPPTAPPPAPYPPNYYTGCAASDRGYGEPICSCNRVQQYIREACICGHNPFNDGCCNMGCGDCGEGELALDCGSRPPLPPANPPPPPRPPNYHSTCANARGYMQPICMCDRVQTSLHEACICGFNLAYDGCCNVGCGLCGSSELPLDCGERPPLPPARPPPPGVRVLPPAPPPTLPPPRVPPPTLPPSHMHCELLLQENTEHPSASYCDVCDGCSGYCPRCEV